MVTAASTGRPEEFGELKRSTFVSLVEVGLSRRQAAIHLGISPSTVSKRMARDPDFAKRVREATLFHEFELLQRMMRQGYRSWRASAWLLERCHPEKYCKSHRKDGKLGPSADEVFDAILAELRGTLPAAIYEEVEQRLGRLAAREFVEIPYPVADGVQSREGEASDEPEAARTEENQTVEAKVAGHGSDRSSADEHEAIKQEDECPVPCGPAPEREPSLLSVMFDKSERMNKQFEEDEEMRRFTDQLKRQHARRRCREQFYEVGLSGVGEADGEGERGGDGERERGGDGGIDESKPSGAVRHSDIRQSSFEPSRFFTTSPDLHEKRAMKNIG